MSRSAFYQPAVFSGKSVHYAADTCVALSAAGERGEVRFSALARGAYPGRALRDKMLGGVCSVGFWDADHPQSWGLDWHRNEGLEFTFLERGALAYSVGNESIELKPGALTITRPWQLHRVGNPNVAPSCLHWLILDVGVRRPNQTWRWPSWLVLAPEDLRRMTRVLRHNENVVWKGNQEIGQCWRSIARAVEADDAGSSHSRLRILINELLLFIAELLERMEPQLDPSLASSEHAVELFLTELQQNPEQRDRRWNLSKMARRCGLGPTHFVNICKRLTNCAPVHYLTRCRLEAARDSLLRDPRTSITEVALSNGFSSSQYFATLFRREFGTTPIEYRKRNGARHRAGEATPAEIWRADLIQDESTHSL